MIVESFMLLTHMLFLFDSPFFRKKWKTGEPPLGGATPRIPKSKMAPHLKLNFMVLRMTAENFMLLSQFASDILPLSNFDFGQNFLPVSLMFTQKL